MKEIKEGVLKTIVLVAMVMCFFSCVNECDILNDKSWQEELKYQLNLNSDVLMSSNLKLIGVEKLDDNCILTIDDFLDDGTLCFPFYVDGLNRFDLAPFRFIEKDTTTLHYNYTSIVNYIDEALDIQNDCMKVGLTWECNGQNVKTFALFDINTGALVYDNILFNILNPFRGRDMMQLTRAETGGGTNNHLGSLVRTSLLEACECWDNLGNLIASASGQYFIYGNWQSTLLRTQEGQPYGYHYTFEYTGLVVNKNTVKGNYSNATAIADYCDCSEGSHVLIKYILWAGLINQLYSLYPCQPLYNSASELPNYSFYSVNNQYLGYGIYSDEIYAVVSETPTMGDVLF